MHPDTSEKYETHQHIFVAVDPGCLLHAVDVTKGPNVKLMTVEVNPFKTLCPTKELLKVLKQRLSLAVS